MPLRAQKRASDVDLSLESGQLDELDLLTDTEIETILFEENGVKTPSPINFSTISGLILMGLGMLHVVSALFGAGFPAGLLSVLAIAGGLLVFRLGLARKKKPKRRRRKSREAVRKKVLQATAAKRKIDPAEFDFSAARKTRPTGLYKSKTQKWIFGVCGGLAERTDIDAVLIRIGFIAATVLSGGPLGPIIYIVLALSMRNPD